MKRNTQRMVVTAVLLALATVLSMIKIFKLPLGGSVTLLSMLPVAMLSIEYGVKWGFASAFLYSLIQFAMDFGEVMSWGLTAGILIASFFCDYILAFTSIGISGLFRKKGVVGICAGIALALFLRFVFHFISGVVLFGDFTGGTAACLLYSLTYNGSYMLPEMIFTMVGASVLFKLPQIQKIMAGDAI